MFRDLKSKREHFLHSFHARARLHDPGPRDHLEVVEPPKPRRRITTKTQEDQYANAKAKLIMEKLGHGLSAGPGG